MPKTPQTRAFGIDPGFGEAGGVYRKLDSTGPLEWATWSAGTGDEFLRALAMAETIVNWMITVLEEDEEDLSETTVIVCVEMHIWKRNAVTYRMQSRLLEELESGLLAVVAPLVGKLLLVEHMPPTAKRVLTGSGNADKQDMINAATSGDAVWGKWMSDISSAPFNTAHTLADAYAHSLVANLAEDPSTNEVLTIRNLSTVRAHPIKHIVRGGQ